MLYRSDSIRHLQLEYAQTEEFKLQPGLSQELSTRDEHAFGFVLQEKLKVTLTGQDRRRSGKALCGELFLVPPDSRCALENISEAPVQLLFIRFHCAQIQWADKTPGPLCAAKAELIDDYQLYCFRTPQIRSWIQDFLSDCGSPEPALYYQLQSHLYAMVAALMMVVQNPREMEQDLVAYVERTRQYMEQRYHEAMDMEDIARLSGASPSRFYQAFRRQTGLSPNKFITKIRLDASLSMLANTLSPVIDVAHSVGYPDEYYFSRLFKKHMGITPTEYAARTKKKIACLSPVLCGDLSVLGITPQLSLDRGWMDDEPVKEKALRRIERFEPELIIAPPLPDDVHETLSAIAPVVVIAWKQYPWKERLLDIGKLFGLSSVAERWLSYFDMKVENARIHIRQHLGDEPMLLVHASGEERFRVFGMKMKKMKDLFYDDLQVMPPSGPAQHIGALDVTSLSDVAKLDCDNVLFLVGAAKPQSFCEQLADRWKGLKQSRGKKRCLFVRHDDPLLYNAAAHEGLVDQTVRLLMQSGS
ncbi:AraC family transcriptional regulator [Paenibacillus doosanensis]|uniref:AraC family transcriptional regulator n=1 Tax=Paenibacillus doosanensis TaxID=1229154 RepID=UPI0021808438|nr:AraC family transcriptional regulator [Paenibacillus doosanensis]MCS7459603.1 AraC family transcriptional regulator [Paenibacillus doosanensis]